MKYVLRSVSQLLRYLPSSAYLVENHLVVSEPADVIRQAVEEDERLESDLTWHGPEDTPHLARG